MKIGEKDELIVNGHKIKCIQASREGPKALPWKERRIRRIVGSGNVGWGCDLHPKKRRMGATKLLIIFKPNKNTKDFPNFFSASFCFFFGKNVAPGIRKQHIFWWRYVMLKNHGTHLNDSVHHPSETTNYKKNIANLRCSLRTFYLLTFWVY